MRYYQSYHQCRSEFPKILRNIFAISFFYGFPQIDQCHPQLKASEYHYQSTIVPLAAYHSTISSVPHHQEYQIHDEPYLDYS